jgi:hypothetical protein
LATDPISATAINRIILLSPTAGAPFDDAGGQVFIFQQDASAVSPFIEFTLRNLRFRPGAGAYALDATTPSFGPLRIHTFNITAGGNIPAFSTVPLPDDPAWTEEDVTMQVYLEEDDGEDAPDVGGLLILEGTNLAD